MTTADMADKSDVQTSVPPSAAGATSIESRLNTLIAVLALVAIAVHLAMRFGFAVGPRGNAVPLYVALVFGGAPLIFELLKQIVRGRFGSDLLAGISIVTAVILGEYLAGTLVVLMLSGGEALEAYAVRQASSVLRALAQRMPSIAHLRRDGGTVDVPASHIQIGDTVLVLPHEICPVDGEVIEGHGSMDESYLTGEPYQIHKAKGSEALSGAVNGTTPLTLVATRKPEDSRYARIMQVMRESEQQRPMLRRLGDTLGALYTPVAVTIAIIAGVIAHDPIRFLAVLVVATPCPLLIAIPVAIIGSISLAAKRGIIIKDPAVLEQLSTCRTIFFDKTGTLTYGEPRLTEIVTAPGFAESETLTLAASIEEYSKHPLAGAVKAAARDRGLELLPVTEASEPPGQGLTGAINGTRIVVTGRKHLSPDLQSRLPPIAPGLEFILLVNGNYAATFRFRDEPRADVQSFIHHLGPRHNLHNLVLLTGDRAAEANRLAERVGIKTVYAEKSPEEKLAIVKTETARQRTAYLGDGINDAPALLAATVGIAFGRATDVTAEAASAVILDSSLRKVDEFLHIAKRLRTIALQSAVGGMALSLIAIGFAATGHLPPVAGALIQEAIDVLVVLNALRAAIPPRSISDM
jgi:heavy metal translocating P-type ATPase